MSEAIDLGRAGLVSPEALERLSKRPSDTKRSEAMGLVSDPAKHFDAERAAMLDDFSHLDNFQLPLNRILVAIWVRPEKSVGGIILPDKVRDEDVFQGVSGLVVKMGPHCYENTDNMDFKWSDADRCDVGDWVMFRRGDGVRVRIFGRECMLLESERGIKMVLPRPDAVF
jgi:co-chaperonin GroES (HSP10)